MIFRRNDYVVISIACFFLGIFIVAQIYASKNYEKVIQPENNEVLALEVARLTKSNADLREEVTKLTFNLDTYKNSTESNQKILDKYNSDTNLYDTLNGDTQLKGQGVTVHVVGKLTIAQVVDLINAIKNIGSSSIAINDTRLNQRTNLAQFSGLANYKIDVIGNSELLQASMTRKGGIVELITTKDIKITVDTVSGLTLPAGQSYDFKYSKILDN